MKWTNVKLVWAREVRDQLRDRRTLFTVAVLPLLLYPLMGLLVIQFSEFAGEQPTRVWVIGSQEIPQHPPLLIEDGAEPRLIAADGPAGEADRRIEVNTTQRLTTKSQDDDAISAEMKRVIGDGQFDAVIYFPPGFSESLREFRQSLDMRTLDRREAVNLVPSPRIYFDAAKERSNIAHGRAADAVRRWREELVEQTLEDSHIPLAATQPFKVHNLDVSEASHRRAAVWSKILPFVLLVWALTGAFYPAIDLCAGEKERGTLETLLTSPASRSEIVWGKLLAITVFSMATSLLNLISLGGTGAFVFGRLQSMAGASSALNLGAPPLESVGWLLVALLPVAMLFSALALAIASMARSTKEGQYYLVPLMLVSMPLMILPMLPTTDLNLGTSLIPLTGLMLLLKRLIEGQYWEALRYALPVIGVTSLCVYLALRWAVGQFYKEDVLFRESERFHLGLWLKRAFTSRKATPTVGAAVLGGVLILVARFYGMFAPAPLNWSQFVGATLFTLIGLVAIPAVLFSLLLARSPRETLLLKPAQPLALFAAALLALAVNPLVHYAAAVVQWVYPVSEATLEKLQGLAKLFEMSPGLWATLLLLALAPAVCEELAFRGFILSGLRGLKGKWRPILFSALFFGVAHGMLQQSIMATLTGLVIGFIAVQTGSLLPCIVYHFVHNATSIVLSALDKKTVEQWPVLNWFLEPAEEAFVWRLWVGLAGGALALLLLWWFARLPAPARPAEANEQDLEALGLEPKPTPLTSV